MKLAKERFQDRMNLKRASLVHLTSPGRAALLLCGDGIRLPINSVVAYLSMLIPSHT